MRLIDADALMKRMYHDAFETDTDMQKWDGGCWIRYKMFENAIDAQPTIDAVSVVRGEWMPNPKIGWGETWVCSICGEKTTSSLMGYPRYNYCPMCGAKMKGADDE